VERGKGWSVRSHRDRHEHCGVVDGLGLGGPVSSRGPKVDTVQAVPLSSTPFPQEVDPSRLPSHWRAQCASLPSGDNRLRARTQRPGEDRDPAILQAVQHAKAGDPEAVRYLYLRYADNVFGYVVSLVRDEHEAEDITQHVFMKLLTVLGKYESRDVPFAAWIMRVARNTAVDHLRQRRQIPCEDVFGPDDSTDEVHHDRRNDLSAALETLPQDQRNVVVLRHLVGLTPGEIADQMGKSHASVHGLHHRGRQALRHELERLDSGPATSGKRQP
jgi:RNA polymerase sigma-70 factor (ECF subfamily)